LAFRDTLSSNGHMTYICIPLFRTLYSVTLTASCGLVVPSRCSASLGRYVSLYLLFNGVSVCHCRVIGGFLLSSSDKITIQASSFYAGCGMFFFNPDTKLHRLSVQKLFNRNHFFLIFDISAVFTPLVAMIEQSYPEFERDSSLVISAFRNCRRYVSGVIV